MSLRIKRSQLTREEVLAGRPIRNASIKWEKDDKGEAILRIPRKKSKTINLLSRIFFIPEERLVSLDKVGTYVWELCDGENSVKTIVKNLQNKFSLNYKESEVSTLEYLKKLMQRGIIGLAVEKRLCDDQSKD